MNWLWRLLGYSVFSLPLEARLIQKGAICDQKAIALAVEASSDAENWCPLSRFTIFVLPSEFEGEYESTVVSEVQRFRATWFRKARVRIKVAADQVSQSAILALISEAQRD